MQTTPQTVASGQTPISIDWDYNNLAYVTEFPSAKWKVNVPADGVYGGYYCQAINATAPHPNAARLWQEFLYSDQGQILYLKGYAHPARFTDMVGRKVIPKALIDALPSGALYNKVKFASLAQQAAAKRGHQHGVAREGRRPSALATHAVARVSVSGRAPSPAGDVPRSPGSASSRSSPTPPCSSSSRPPRSWSARSRATTAATRSTTSPRSSETANLRDAFWASIRDQPRDRAPRRAARPPDRLRGDPQGHAAAGSARRSAPSRAWRRTSAASRSRSPSSPRSGTIGIVTQFLKNVFGINLYDHGFAIWSAGTAWRARLPLLPDPADDPRDRAGDRRPRARSGARRRRTSARAGSSTGATSGCRC